MERVTILYRRPPDRLQTFEQLLVEETADHVVTLLEAAPLPRPIVVGGSVVLEPGAPVVWHTYPGRWYDIGLFHLRDGTPTGAYANVLTPVVIEGRRWNTTDLFLDVWSGADGRVEILDGDEFEEAVARGWIDASTAATARAQAEALAEAAGRGEWPPEHVRRWTLERARERVTRPPPP